MSARRLTLAGLVSLCALVAAALLCSVPALAAEGHAVSTFNGSPGTALEHPWGIDVNGAGGDVLVADSSNHQVAKFNLAGVPEEFTSLHSNELTGVGATPPFGEIDSVASPPGGTGEIYADDYGDNVVDVFNAAGEYLSQLSEVPASSSAAVTGAFKTPFAVAVDPSSGDVWVVDNGHDTVDEFEPEEGGKKFKYLAQIEASSLLVGEPLSGLQDVAVDSEGNVYLAGTGSASRHQVVDKFNSAGVFVDVIDPNGGGSVAVDTSTTPNTVYVIEGNEKIIGSYSATSSTGIPIEQFGTSEELPLQDVGVASTTHVVYATNYNDSRVDVFTPGSKPEKPETLLASGETATTAVLQGKLKSKVNYYFEYNTGASCSGGSRTSVEEGEGEVSTEATGLEPRVSYKVCLVAENSLGRELGNEVSFSTLGLAPRVEGSVTEVASESATLNAEIDPNGEETEYRFEYGTSSAYGQSTPESALGASDDSPHPASAAIEGLAPGTVYHYRVVASNSIAPDGVLGPDQTFTTQASGSEFALPDGRQWEMITPPNKHGAGLIAVGNEQGADIQAAEDGGGITYAATAPIVESPAGSRSPEVTQIISARHAPGVWETADIATPHTEGATELATGHESEYKLFSNDLSLGLVEPEGHTPLPPLPPGAEKTIYLREANGEYKALVTSANVPPGTKFGGNSEGQGGVQLVSASPDLSHVVLRSVSNFGSVKLTSEGPENGLYEWAGGKLQAVSVLPNGEPTSGVLGDADEGREGNARDAISNDGSRVIWATGEFGESLYMRDMVRRETVSLGIAEYLTANSEDSRVFFNNGDLSVFEVTSGKDEPLAGKVTDLAPGLGLDGMIGASEDGSYVYFVANGDRLYVDRYDEGTKAWAPPTFIAALSGGDESSWGGNDGGDLAGLTSRVSPNGRYLAFMSENSLTGYDNRDANSGVPDKEIFLYDASAGRLTCASCDPTGARPVGVASIPGWDTTSLSTALYQSRYLSDSGRLFFNSSDALVPADVNGKEDVYEYEPVGVGSCLAPDYGQSASVSFSESAGGCVGLISAGTSSEESTFLDASETGGDVFFLTESRLSPQDYDNSYDIYDAHECTASVPCAPSPSLTPPPCTTGDACKPAPTPQPAIFGASSSETFSGVGNVTPVTTSPPKKITVKSKKCKKGLVKKRGKCVKQKPKKRTGKSDRKGRR